MAGKYEFEIISGTASFMTQSIPFRRFIRGHGARGYTPLDDATGFEHLYLVYLAICSAFVRTSLSTNASRSTGLVRFPVVTSRSRIQASLVMGIAISGSTADKRLISS